MATKQRYQNPAVGDDLILRLFSYNVNSRTNFASVDKVEIYYIDPSTGEKSLTNTITDIENVETGQYQVSLSLTDPLYVIGQYVDIWYVTVEGQDVEAKIENNFEVMPDLWYTSPVPIVYDFSFNFRPNKIRKGSKKYIIIDIMPNVPKATDMARYYENLSITSPLKISIEMNCGECIPKEEDLRIVADREDVELREKNVGYYFIDTTELNEGVYDVWFEMEFGESLHISDKQQLQIY